MKTAEEILNKINEHKDEVFGFIASDLINYLPYEDVKHFLKPDVTKEDWEPAENSKKAIEKQILDYLPFAWEKANDCRGLSAGRNIDRFSAWFWLLGYTDFSKEMRKYSFYGKPQLALVSEHFNFNWKEQDNGEWLNGECELPGDIDEILNKYAHLKGLLKAKEGEGE